MDVPGREARVLRIHAQVSRDSLRLLVAATGLVIFGSYIGVTYGRAALGGRPGEARWVAGDWLGNSMLSVHLVFALLLTVIGVQRVLSSSLRMRMSSVMR